MEEIDMRAELKMKKFGIRLVIGLNGIQICEAGHLQKEINETESLWYFSNKSLGELQNIAEKDFEEFCKRNKGVGIAVKNEVVIIYNDPYCTVPIYVSKDENHIIVTSDFEEFYRRDYKVDVTGFYEILLYGSGVYDRTLLEGVKQMPAASKCIINLKRNNYKMVPYWNFEIFENPKYKNIDLAVRDVDHRLRDIFAELKPNICMGISGGLDSRLSACMLHETQEVKDLLFYTFGYHSKIFDYKLAKKVIYKLWNNGTKPQHEFFQLTSEDYLQSEYVPVSTGAQVGLDHIHMYRCIQRMKNSCKTFISNYYSDAVMGYDALPIKRNELMEDSSYYKRLKKNFFYLTDSLIQEIEEDLTKVCRRCPASGNFTCIDEFIYVTERTPKFHVRLSAAMAEFVHMELPYADFELLNIMLSIPAQNRAEKLIEHKIINRYLKNLKDISSKRYPEHTNSTDSIGEKIYYYYGYLRMRAINVFNVFVAKATGYKYQMVNPYLTENQNYILNNYLYNEFTEALEYLKNKKLVGDVFYKAMKKKEYRSTHTSVKFALIGIWKCLMQMEIE